MENNNKIKGDRFSNNNIFQSKILMNIKYDTVFVT